MSKPFNTQDWSRILADVRSLIQPAATAQKSGTQVKSHV